ncbi:unnamed protein product [Timema podura]|uniref:Uncharacterized protein n=1 Tax=Timema podura TaxID=61482 RepID=A0ABN7NSB0_TIMPD|nr:unnamed protein product [Timema podura]
MRLNHRDEIGNPRLRCLTHVVMKLEKCNSNMLQQIVPEAILCCKDINERCRTAAYNLLTEIGKAMQRWLDKPTDDIIRDYLGLINGWLGRESYLGFRDYPGIG